MPGSVSQGKAEQEAIANIKDAIKQCLEAQAELFNGVNLEMGYTKRLEMVTPMEVSRYEG